MKCLCTQTSQIRIGGKIHTITQGEVRELKKLPKAHWVSLEEGSDESAPKYLVDFSKAEKAELMAVKGWTFEEARDFVKTNYNVDINKGTKTQITDQILDARFRFVNLPKS